VFFLSLYTLYVLGGVYNPWETGFLSFHLLF